MYADGTATDRSHRRRSVLFVMTSKAQEEKESQAALPIRSIYSRREATYVINSRPALFAAERLAARLLCQPLLCHGCDEVGPSVSLRHS